LKHQIQLSHRVIEGISRRIATCSITASCNGYQRQALAAAAPAQPGVRLRWVFMVRH
jgi:hypothetical protein